jgi:hypothetical protein
MRDHPWTECPFHKQPEGAPTFACAECGTTEATTYVVTFLDGDQTDPEARTEVCLPCHEEIRQ